MADILTRAGCFIAIILLGMVLRRVGFFKQEDFYVLSKIVVKITLTAAIVKSFVGRELEPSMIADWLWLRRAVDCPGCGDESSQSTQRSGLCGTEPVWLQYQ